MRKGTVVVCACVATALLIAGAGIAARSVADARWAEMTAWMQQAGAEYARRDTARPVAHGGATADAAFPHYRRALALAQPLLEDHDRLVRRWCQDMLQKPHKDGLLTPAECAAIRAVWLPVLDEMRAGAHCARTGPAVDFAAPLDTANLLAARWVVNSSVLEARAAMESGNGQLAVQWLLEALTFALDLSRSPQRIDRMIGVGVGSAVVLAGCAEERLAELDRDALDLLATGLARLDDDALARVRCEDDVLTSAHYLLQLPDEDSGPTDAWRFAFSERWMHAAAVLAAVDAARVLDRTPEPCTGRQRVREQQDELAWGSTNPLLALVWDAYASWDEPHLRTALAQLRMLRLAVDLHRGASLPSLQDPFAAAPFTIERGPDTVRFVSAGKWSRGDRIDRTARPPR